jgi:hypothetical protein
MFLAMPGVEAVEEHEGNQIRLSMNGQTLVLHRPRDKDIPDEDLIRARRFLESAAAAAPAQPVPAGEHLLVVIDHREARIYAAELHGTVPHRIIPYDPFGFGRELHYNQDDSNGQRKPERKSFYEAVAKTLLGAKEIVMFGTGTGASSAMEELVRDLRKHHHVVADKILATIAVDEHHLTEAQLLAKARDLFVPA